MRQKEMERFKVYKGDVSRAREREGKGKGDTWVDKD
jgi:hypothetical protein